MAERRRRSGHLRGAILRLLRPDRAIGPLDLREQLEREGETTAPNQIFRALGQLIDQGLACKVLVARGYALAPAPHMVTLYCRSCGRLTAVPDAPLLDELAYAAAAHGFTQCRRFVEVAGTCAACAAPARPYTEARDIS